MSGLLEIAGIIFSGVSSLDSAKSLYKDFMNWKEHDSVVDNKWLEVAIKYDKLPGKITDYYWSRPEKVITRELKKTHHTVFVYDHEKKIRGRVLLSDGCVLLRRIIC